MNTVKLSLEVVKDLKARNFKSIIIFGASNPTELKDNSCTHLLASKEPVFEERVTQNSFHVSIDDPVIIEICRNSSVFIEIPL